MLKTGFDFTEHENGGYLNAPQVWAVGSGNDCSSKKLCLEKQPGISVNNMVGSANKPVEITDYPAKATIKFYAYATPDRMPLKQISVDFGDGSTPITVAGSFRNQRGPINGKCGYSIDPTNGKVEPKKPTGKGDKCYVAITAWDDNNSLTYGQMTTTYVRTSISCTDDKSCTYIDQCFSESEAPNFGQIKDKTCDNAYFSVDTVYQCDKSSDNYRASGSPECTAKFTDGCCVFYPRVQVVDNWGWCNGVCGTAASAGGVGCYNKVGKNECLITSPDPWTTTNTLKGGIRVLVAPK